jgi:LysM repeat protein
MRKLWIIGALIGILLTLGLAPLPVPEQVESPSQVIAAVNAFRTTHGLPALEVDYALMGAAQAHSDYQAAIGKVTHTGEGGTRPIDRAYAWGFGSGATAFVSENIAGGYKVTIETAIYDFWQDSAHLHTMLNPNAVYIGAGVATSGKSNYYTVETGYYVGSKPKTTPAPGSTPVARATSVPGSTVVAYDPFVISTPREDGAIIHVVGYGQTLIGIANTYGVSLEDLYRFNSYSKDEIIYPNEWVIIQPAGETLITATPENLKVIVASTKTDRPPRATYTPRELQSTRPLVVVNPSPTPTTTAIAITAGQGPLIVGVVILSLMVLVGVIFYGLFSHR